jgi:hypothetical protein
LLRVELKFWLDPLHTQNLAKGQESFTDEILLVRAHGRDSRDAAISLHYPDILDVEKVHELGAMRGHHYLASSRRLLQVINEQRNGANVDSQPRLLYTDQSERRFLQESGNDASHVQRSSQRKA